MTAVPRPLAADAPDPAFTWTPGGPLLPRSTARDDDAWALLGSRIVRDPLDVESHARRVLLAQRRQRPDDVFGALVDLFLATGTRAHGLRAALLAQAAPTLDTDGAAFLQAALGPGLEPQAALPLGTRARLDRGVTGTTALVTPPQPPAPTAAGAGADAPIDPADVSTAHAQAAALIDQGDVAAARTLLERAVLADPHDTGCARELQAIYHHARDRAARDAMRQRLAAQLGQVPAAWA